MAWHLAAFMYLPMDPEQKVLPGYMKILISLRK